MFCKLCNKGKILENAPTGVEQDQRSIDAIAVWLQWLQWTLILITLFTLLSFYVSFYLYLYCSSFVPLLFLYCPSIDSNATNASNDYNDYSDYHDNNDHNYPFQWSFQLSLQWSIPHSSFHQQTLMP